MSIIKRPESKVLIRFPDCDPFNHLNNSRYIDYFINAREDHLYLNYQFNPYQYAQEKFIKLGSHTKSDFLLTACYANGKSNHSIACIEIRSARHSGRDDDVGLAKENVKSNHLDNVYTLQFQDHEI